MTEQMEKFLEKLGDDEEAKNKLKELDADDRDACITGTIEIAKGMGFELVRNDFEQEEVSELDEDELSAVAGGATACACAVAGAGASGDGLYGGCGCAMGGAGNFYYDVKHKNIAGFCRCVLAGGGGV